MMLSQNTPELKNNLGGLWCLTALSTIF